MNLQRALTGSRYAGLTRGERAIHSPLHVSLPWIAVSMMKNGESHWELSGMRRITNNRSLRSFGSAIDKSVQRRKLSRTGSVILASNQVPKQQIVSVLL